MSLYSFFRISKPSASRVPEGQVDASYKRLRERTFWGVTVAYTLYYVCRGTLGVVKQPLIDSGTLTAGQLGIIGSAFYFVYAIGKFTNGFIADYCNIRRFMAVGIGISAVVNLILGLLGLLGTPLGLGSLATVSRLMRTSMLDVLSSDYIKTAKSKGLSQGQIIRRHALRNAIMPVITIMGPTVASVLTGTFVIESIFNIPGLGKYFVISIKDLDYTMISGTVVFYGGLLILCTNAKKNIQRYSQETIMQQWQDLFHSLINNRT